MMKDFISNGQMIETFILNKVTLNTYYTVSFLYILKKKTLVKNLKNKYLHDRMISRSQDKIKNRKNNT